MNLTVGQSTLRGRVAIPGSKSHTIRAVALAGLAEGISEIEAPLCSADTEAAVRGYRALGAEIRTGRTWQVRGVGGRPTAPADIIDVGNSGTTLRFAAGAAALLDEGAAVFTGDAQIRSRPMGPLLQSLVQLGGQAWSTRGNDKAPVVVGGRLRGGRTQIAAVTSQYLSSLLFCCPLAETDVDIEVTELNEAPYVAITLAYLDEQGVEYHADGAYRSFHVPGGQRYHAFRKRIPADFSSATFFLCGAALLAGSEVMIEGLDFDDPQGDKAVVDMLRKMGARIELGDGVVVVRGGPLQGAELNLNGTPDALPALAVTACFAEGPTRLGNVAQARLKETDRIAVMTGELRRLGAEVDELPDGMVITPRPLHGAAVAGHDDHRVVMALSLAGMALPAGCTIDTAEAMNVTFPQYVDLMRSLGAVMHLG